LGHFDQRVLEFIKGIYIPAATGFDGGEEDGVALAAFDVIDGKPLFLPAAMGRMASSKRLLSIVRRPLWTWGSGARAGLRLLLPPFLFPTFGRIRQ